ncbi:MAG: hypothetical protein ACE14P_05515 [Methanotrichaceae archaeon]
MKLIVAALFILMTAVVVIQLVSSTAFDFKGHSLASDPVALSMEMKIAESLHNIASSAPYGQPDKNTVNQKADGPSTNSSAVNLSINATSNNPYNSSALNSSAELTGSGGEATTGGSAISDSGAVSSQGLGASSKGAIKGFYGIQAKKHVMGQSDIKSQMFLSGSFDVDKTVKFSE